MKTRERVTSLAALGGMAAAVLLVGGAMRWAQICVGVLLGIGLIANLLARRDFARVPPLMLGLLCAIGLTVIQLIPLPDGLLSSLQPTGAGLRADGAALVGTSPWHALTLDAPSTLRSLAFLIILLAAARLGLWIAASDKGRYRILASVAGLCGATAVIVGIHELVGAHALYGLYEPAQARPSVLGPLLNENHLGGLMMLGACVSLGLALHTRQKSWLRAVWVLIVGACSVIVAASESRGAVIGLGLGILVIVALLLGQRFGSTDRRSRAPVATTSIPIFVVVACAIVVVIYAGAGNVSDQLARTRVDSELHAPKSKFSIWRSSMHLVEEAPILGIGRGAFEPVITRVHPAAAVATFSHVENEYVQATVEWGLVGIVALAVCGAAILLSIRRRWKDGAMIAGAIGATAAIAAQSSVDFGVELLGVAVPVIAVLSTITSVELKEATERSKTTSRVLRAAQVVALGIMCVLLTRSSTASVADDHAAIAAHPPKTLDELRPMLERHPLDYYNFAIAADMLTKSGDPNGVRVLNHALRLHPLHPGLHHLAARLLVRANASEQALSEYAAAVRTSTTPRELVKEIVTRFPKNRAFLAIPFDYSDRDAIVKIMIEEGGTSEMATRWLLRTLELHPGDTLTCTWLYTIAMRDWNALAVDGISKRCVDAAPDLTTRVALARHQLKMEHFDDALRLVSGVEKWEGRINDKADGWLVQCDVLTAQREWDRATDCVRALDRAALPDARLRTAVATRLDEIRDGRAKADMTPSPAP